METKATLKRVEIRNFKNIARAVVELKPLTVIVGPNGAGKSNFVDALTFVSDCLNHSVQLAFKNRGGISAVRRHSLGHPTHISTSLRVDWADWGWAQYSFEIAAKPREAFRVAHERCLVQQVLGDKFEYELKDGQLLRSTPNINPKVEPDRLMLTLISGSKEFRPVFDFLTGIRRYNLRPERLRELQDPDPNEGSILLSDGSNAAAVLRRISEQTEENGHVYERICSLLSKIVPGVSGVNAKPLGNKETLEFRQDVGADNKWRFEALNMSDGTLRVLGIMLAIYQRSAATLAAIEEPESTVHPAAVDILMDLLMEGANRSQILITTHSPEVLDNKKLFDNQILAMESKQGVGQITPLKETTRETIREKLYTPGELLRMGEIGVDDQYAKNRKRQGKLFPNEEP